MCVCVHFAFLFFFHFQLLQVTDNEFVLSFLHKPQTDITSKFYYAFTFPFTYTECQNQLARFDSLYLKSEDEMNYILQRLNVDDVDVNCNTINFENTDTEGVENVQNVLNGMAINNYLFIRFFFFLVIDIQRFFYLKL